MVQVVCDRIPRAIGAVLCDQHGETIVSVLGAADVPPEARDRAKEHVPTRIGLNMPVNEFLVRLAGAEPCALLRQLQVANDGYAAGVLDGYVARYAEVDLIVEPLPEDLYLLVVLRRPASVGHARYHTGRVARRLQAFLD